MEHELFDTASARALSQESHLLNMRPIEGIHAMQQGNNDS